MSATAQGGNGDEVADLETGRNPAEFDNLTCEFVTENDAWLDPERRFVRHMQIAAADAATPDPDQQFGAGGMRIADILNDQWLVQFVKDRCFHVVSSQHTVADPSAKNKLPIRAAFSG